MPLQSNIQRPDGGDRCIRSTLRVLDGARVAAWQRKPLHQTHQRSTFPESSTALSACLGRCFVVGIEPDDHGLFIVFWVIARIIHLHVKISHRTGQKELGKVLAGSICPGHHLRDSAARLQDRSTDDKIDMCPIQPPEWITKNAHVLRT